MKILNLFKLEGIRSIITMENDLEFFNLPLFLLVLGLGL